MSINRNTIETSLDKWLHRTSEKDLDAMMQWVDKEYIDWKEKPESHTDFMWNQFKKDESFWKLLEDWNKAYLQQKRAKKQKQSVVVSETRRDIQDSENYTFNNINLAQKAASSNWDIIINQQTSPESKETLSSFESLRKDYIKELKGKIYRIDEHNLSWKQGLAILDAKVLVRDKAKNKEDILKILVDTAKKLKCYSKNDSKYQKIDDKIFAVWSSIAGFKVDLNDLPATSKETKKKKTKSEQAIESITEDSSMTTEEQAVAGWNKVQSWEIDPVAKQQLPLNPTKTETVSVSKEMQKYADFFWIDAQSLAKLDNLKEKYWLNLDLAKYLSPYYSLLNGDLKNFQYKDKLIQAVWKKAKQLINIINKRIAWVDEQIEEWDYEASDKIKEIQNQRWIINEKLNSLFDDFNNKVLYSALVLQNNIDTSSLWIEKSELEDMFKADLTDDWDFDQSIFEWVYDYWTNNWHVLDITDENHKAFLAKHNINEGSGNSEWLLSEKDKEIEEEVELYWFWILWALILNDVASFTWVWTIPWAALWIWYDTVDLSSDEDAGLLLLRSFNLINEDYRTEKSWVDFALAWVSIIPWATALTKTAKFENFVNNLSPKKYKKFQQIQEKISKLLNEKVFGKTELNKFDDIPSINSEIGKLKEANPGKNYYWEADFDWRFIIKEAWDLESFWTYFKNADWVFFKKDWDNLLKVHPKVIKNDNWDVVQIVINWEKFKANWELVTRSIIPRFDEATITKNARLTDADRITEANRLLGRNLDWLEIAEILKVHNFETGNIMDKYHLLGKHFSRKERLILLRSWICGKLDDFDALIDIKKAELRKVDELINDSTNKLNDLLSKYKPSGKNIDKANKDFDDAVSKYKGIENNPASKADKEKFWLGPKAKNGDVIEKYREEILIPIEQRLFNTYKNKKTKELKINELMVKKEKLSNEIDSITKEKKLFEAEQAKVAEEVEELRRARESSRASKAAWASEEATSGARAGDRAESATENASSSARANESAESTAENTSNRARTAWEAAKEKTWGWSKATKEKFESLFTKKSFSKLKKQRIKIISDWFKKEVSDTLEKWNTFEIKLTNDNITKIYKKDGNYRIEWNDKVYNNLDDILNQIPHKSKKEFLWKRAKDVAKSLESPLWIKNWVFNWKWKYQVSKNEIIINENWAKRILNEAETNAFYNKYWIELLEKHSWISFAKLTEWLAEKFDKLSKSNSEKGMFKKLAEKSWNFVYNQYTSPFRLVKEIKKAKWFNETTKAILFWNHEKAWLWGKYWPFSSWIVKMWAMWGLSVIIWTWSVDWVRIDNEEWFDQKDIIFNYLELMYLPILWTWTIEYFDIDDWFYEKFE